jgi:hypothetical protein
MLVSVTDHPNLVLQVCSRCHPAGGQAAARQLCAGLLRAVAGQTLLLLWLSAIASAFIDNIPFVATFIPLITEIGKVSGMAIGPLWWALALGACLGGNGTIIGASANDIVSGIAAREGFPISFGGFMRIAFPLMLVSIVISTGYLLIFYVKLILTVSNWLKPVLGPASFCLEECKIK